jgi:hypothetical protein
MLNVGGGGDGELLANRAESQNRNVRVSCISRKFICVIDI